MYIYTHTHIVTHTYYTPPLRLEDRPLPLAADLQADGLAETRLADINTIH